MKDNLNFNMHTKNTLRSLKTIFLIFTSGTRFLIDETVRANRQKENRKSKNSRNRILLFANYIEV